MVAVNGLFWGGGGIDAAWEGRSGPTDETHEACVRSTSLSLFSLHENATDEVGRPF